ncbi:MAG: hypothetical protein COA53_06520 [Rhodobacteraceae bacterium]|nr:MAG: hypothetical protein COA53_06520 [Paracoccaceae bacterium]
MATSRHPINFDKGVLSIPCPQCGNETQKSIGWIKRKDEFICAGCSNTVTYDANVLLSGLDSANKDLDAFSRSFGKFGK